ncbi:uncharacterized protein RSE6_05947 [Rhynchosporium secalis]|uniref:Zn(2)-C6 fungal-type domain-containing protein n=1 Tax=Rhynchosporium secalis TaxID=38038 RepID=A0A1E1M945_RHYSE|nr:uncharacterized protein RSE6_05947 [Rhynchosporium secalis]
MTSGTLVSDTSSFRNHQSVRACVACRQMKMKCEGSEDPPCSRCRKVGRDCIPQASTRPKAKSGSATQQYHVNTYQNVTRPATNVATDPLQTNNPRYLLDQAPSVDTSTQDESVIPSIYSTPPVNAVLESRGKTSPPSNFETTVLRKRKRYSTYSPSNGVPTPGSSNMDVDRTLLSKTDMKEMIQLFVQRHLPFTSIFPPKAFDDPDSLIENNLKLVYCICFVTARYLPGGKEMRSRLLPEVAKIPRGVLSMEPGNHHDDELAALRCLGVLSLYAALTPPSRSSDPSANSEVQFRHLKSVIEMYGTRLGLHRSVQDLRAELRSGSHRVMESKAFQKYICWLAMFCASHHTSIISGTPPTIHIDSSIRAVPKLMQEIGQMSECNRNLFGQIDLNLIWEKASAQHPRLGEWWAPPDSSEIVDENSVEAVLGNTDREIDAWYVKWSDCIRSSEQGSFLDFNARFTRFCITSYTIKFLRNSSHNLTPLQKDQIRRCVVCANCVLQWPLSRSPIQKDRLRFVDDTSCVMNSFCCLFIISVCQAYAAIIPNIFDLLDNVIETAHLMVDLQVGFDDSNTVHVQGSTILKRAESMRTALESSRVVERLDQDITSPSALDENGLQENQALFEGLDSILNEEGFFAMEPIWDFPLLFSSM